MGSIYSDALLFILLTLLQIEVSLVGWVIKRNFEPWIGGQCVQDWSVEDKFTIGSADQHIVLLPTESIIDGSVALFTLL